VPCTVAFKAIAWSADPNPETMNNRQVDSRIALALIGAAVMGVGSVAPWATALGGTIGVNGTTGDGKITLVCAIICAVATIAASNGGRSNLALAAIAALVGGGVGLYDLLNISSLVGSTYGLAQIGWGLYAVVIGGAVALGAAFMARQERAPLEQSAPTVPPAAPFD
jgi:hypothetical protein